MSGFEALPNEMIFAVLNWLSPEQQVGVSRSCLLWKYLTDASTKTPLVNTIHYSFPFLTREELNKSNLAQLDKKLKHLQSIYTHLAKAQGLSPEGNLIDAPLKDFQIAFLNAFAVASGVIEEDESVNNGQAFIYMAAIDNINKLKTWHTSFANQISAEHKGHALIKAAAYGHLDCLTYLFEKCGDISLDNKYEALLEAARGGYLDCMTYLIKKCWHGLSERVQSRVILPTAQYGRLDCLTYLIETCWHEIGDYRKLDALERARYKGNTECIRLLEESLIRRLSYSAPTINKMMHI